MTRTAPVWIALLTLSPLYGQAGVEFGNLLGGVTTAGVPAGNVGQSLSDIIANSLKNMPKVPPQAPVFNMGAWPNQFSRGPARRIPVRGGIPGLSNGTDANGANQFMRAWMNAFGGMMPGAQSSSEVTVVPPEKMSTPKPSNRTFEDPQLIQPGLGYDELIDRFGPPLMELTTGPGMKSLMYANPDGSTRTVELQDDKVAAPAEAALKPKPRPAEPRNYVPMTIR